MVKYTTLVVICIVTLLLLIAGFSKTVHATTCSKTITPGQFYTETTLNKDISSYALAPDNQEYVICFIQNKPLVISKTITISASEAKPFMITGLQIITKEGVSFSPLLTLSSSNITLQTVALTGAGNGTGIKVDGKNIVIDGATIGKFANAIETTANSSSVAIKGGNMGSSILLAGSNHAVSGLALVGSDTGTGIKIEGSNIAIDSVNISKFATTVEVNGNNFGLKTSALAGPTPAQGQAPTGTAVQVNGTGAVIGPTVSLTNFSIGIEVKQGASANITQDSFTNIAEPIYWVQPFWQADPITVEWLGKHVSAADASVIDRIAGKVDVPECAGSVEMYMREKDAFDAKGNPYPIAYRLSCPVTALKDKKVTFKTADGAEKDIPDGACYFDCDKLEGVLIDNYISFAFVSAQNVTAELMPMPVVKLSDLQKVIWVPLAPEQTGGTNNANGPGDGTQYIDQTNLPNTDNKNQVTGNTGPSGAGPVGDGPTGFGASGCSLIR